MPSVSIQDKHEKDIAEKLYDSIKTKNVATVKAFLTQYKNIVNSKLYGYEGADIYATSESTTNRCYIYTGRETDGFFYPLHLAAETGSKAIVQLLLKFNANSSNYDYKKCLAENKCNGNASHAFYEARGLKFEAIDRYEGEYDRNGLRCGSGVLYLKPEGYLSKEQILYRGGFKNGQYNGYGTLYYEKNSNIKLTASIDDNDNDNEQVPILHYVGRFKDSLMHGRGILFNEKGQKVYRGSFRDGIREGRGEEFEENIRLYKGEFANGFRHGFGIMYFSEGHRFMGRFDKGNMSGLGYYSFPNGERYEGMYFNNKFEGPGSFYRTSGPIHATWSKGAVQKEESTPFVPLSVDIPEKKEISILNGFIYGTSDNDDSIENDNISKNSDITKNSDIVKSSDSEIIQQKLKKAFMEAEAKFKDRDSWKITLSSYLNISKTDAKEMGISWYKGDDDDNTIEVIDNDDDDFLNHDDEITRFHFVDCPNKNLLTAFVYVTCIQKVFEGRLASTSLHEAVPDFEEIYHLVIDAVELYNDSWETKYLDQLETTRIQDKENQRLEKERLEAEKKEKAKYQYIAPPVTKRASVNIGKTAAMLFENPAPIEGTALRRESLDDKRRLFMSTKEKREEEIAKQREELEAKKTKSQLDSKIEIKIGTEVINDLHNDLMKLVDSPDHTTGRSSLVPLKTNEFAEELLYLMKLGHESLPDYEKIAFQH